MPEKSVDLKVADPDPTHVGRNIVTLDRETKRHLEITSGDIVEIEGTKKTAAIVWPARASDEGRLLIRMDSFIRHNSGVGLGEKVTVRRLVPKEAKKVVLAPTQEIRIIASGYDRILKKNFLGRPLTIGDSVWISVFGSGFVYRVIDTTPRGTVKVTDFTQITLKEKPVKGELEAVPRVSYDDIGGLDEPIRKVREMVELPMRHPEIFRKLGIVPPKGVLLYGPPGCLTGESLVALEDGRLVRIEELASNLLPGIYVADLPVYPPAHAKAIHVYDVPETVEIFTETGKRLRMTPNHPLLLKNRRWKEARYLGKGDEIKTFDWIPNPDSYVKVHFELNQKMLHQLPKIPKIFDEDLGFILGVFVAEGNFEHGRIKFAIHRNEKQFAEEIISKTKSLFGVKHTDFYDKHKNVRKIRFANRGLSDFFKKFWDKHKRVPSEILLSPNSVVASFLKGLFEGDGSVVKKNHHFDRAVTLKSRSRQLVEEVQTLLLRWSIKSAIYTYPTKWAPSNTLKISGRTNLERFYSNIGFVSKNKLGKLKHHLNTYSRKYSTAPKQFEKIKEIKKLKGWQRVYDFEIPTTHSFFSNGILSHNTGKTLLAKAVANETQAHFISINAPEVMSKFVGEAEERIRQMFKDAEENAPSIIFIDEIDAIAPKREEVIGEVERRVVAQILALMDGLEARGNVIVIAATNRVNSLDEALRRPGRFDREIEFPVPNKIARKEILLIHTRGMPLAKDVDLDQFASITHGFVGADLAALGKEAAMKALRRYLPKINLEDEAIPQEILESLEVNRRDFQNGLKDVQPSALREVTIEIPNVKWADIGNLEEAKEELKQAVEWPLKYPESFKKMGIKPPAGILLFGPPGCGKTLLAKAVASESEANFISVKGPELLSLWVGESERGIRKVFRKARQVSPCIVFFDEIDSIATRRGLDIGSHATERVVNQMLTELDGIEQNRGVVFMAATNRPDLLDPGLLRPGRIDKFVKIEAPDSKGRMAIFKVHTRNVNLAKDVSLAELVKKTDGFSGADIEGLIRAAALIALKESKMKACPITKRHLDEALSKAKPSITPKVEEAYEEIEEHLGEFKPSYVG